MDGALDAQGDLGQVALRQTNRCDLADIDAGDGHHRLLLEPAGVVEDGVDLDRLLLREPALVQVGVEPDEDGAEDQREQTDAKGRDEFLHLLSNQSAKNFLTNGS